MPSVAAATANSRLSRGHSRRRAELSRATSRVFSSAPTDTASPAEPAKAPIFFNSRLFCSHRLQPSRLPPAAQFLTHGQLTRFALNLTNCATGICWTSSFVSGLCAYYWTRVGCASIADRKRGSLTTSLSSSRYVPFLFLLKPVDVQYTQYYLLCKEPMPMDVEFMVLDSLEAIRPKVALLKNIEDAANAVDEMFASTV